MSFPEIPPLCPEKHRWQTSKADPRITQRRALGNEVIVGRKDANTRGENDMQQVTTLTMATHGPSLSSLRDQLEAGLLFLRFQHPEVAATLAWDDEDIAPWIQYAPPQNQETARAWARGCVRVHASPKTGVETWTEIEDERRAGGYAEPEKSITVHVVADVPDDKTPIPVGNAVYILFSLNHVFWDGFTCRTLVGDILRTLNETPEEPTAWGQEIGNLSSPVLDALKPGVEFQGVNFEDARDEFLRGRHGAYGSCGIKFRPGTAEPRVIHQTFSPAQSNSILAAIKTRLGPKYTISHLGQAATFLAMLATNPPPRDLPENQAFTTPIAMNGRRWLDDAHAATYYAMCLTGGVVRFNKVKSLMVDWNDKLALAEALRKACADVKDSFDGYLSGKHHLPVGLAVHAFEGAFLATTPNPFKDVANPVFLSDGLNDRFIPKEIVNEDTNEIMMTVDHAMVYQNQLGPFYVLRLESFRGASTLSLTFNEANHTPDEANAFLDTVLSYMTTFAEVSEGLHLIPAPVEESLASKTASMVHVDIRSIQETVQG